MTRFAATNTLVAALSADTRENLEHLATSLAAPFPIVHDPEARIMRAAGAYRKESRKGPLPYPTVLAFDPAGVLVYKNVTPNLIRRTKPAAVLAALEAHAPARA